MNEIEIYTAKDTQIEVRVTFEQETVWLSQKQMSELFGKDKDTIGLHLKTFLLKKNWKKI